MKGSVVAQMAVPKCSLYGYLIAVNGVSWAYPGASADAVPVDNNLHVRRAYLSTQVGCLSPSDFWIWDYHTDSLDNRTVLGGPSQTSNCFPPTWVSTGEYIGTQCPLQYTATCQATDPLELVTCCPKSEPKNGHLLRIKTDLSQRIRFQLY